MKKRLLVIPSILLVIGCNRIDSNLQADLTKLSENIASLDSIRIKTISTNSGYESIKMWSNNFKDKNFLKTLSNNLAKSGQGVFDLKEKDSLIYLSLGKSDKIVGATGGGLILRRYHNKISIEEFLGGK